MAMESLVVRPFPAPILAVEAKAKSAPVGFQCQPTKRSSVAFSKVFVTCCSASSSSSSSSSERAELVEAFLHPKPFGKKPLLMRMGKGPTYVEKTSKELSDYCMKLEGDDCCSCWEAYLELGVFEREWPERRVENLITAAGGLDSLITSLHSCKAMEKSETKASTSSAPLSKGESEPKVKKVEEVDRAREVFPIPDGLPKSKEELEEEKGWLDSMLPDSPHTRLLRAMHIYPAWYTPRPDHETD